MLIVPYIKKKEIELYLYSKTRAGMYLFINKKLYIIFYN